MTGEIRVMNYNSKSLLDVKFKKNVKGYDALEVDKTLDDVLADYTNYEKETLNNKKLISKLETEVESLKEKVRTLEVEKQKLQKVVDAIPDAPGVNKSNIVYLQRIADLEKALYKKGVNPKKI